MSSFENLDSGQNIEEVREDQPSESGRPFTINVSERVKRLPPYLFAELNNLKFAKRRAGDDVIDLGMGSPSDPPKDFIIDKLCEVAHDPKLHGYSHAKGMLKLRNEVAKRYKKYYNVTLDPETDIVGGLGSKETFSHMCLALLGHGDTAIVPGPTYPAHMYAVALAGANYVLFDATNPEKYLQNVAYTCENHYPKPKLVIVNYPHNPTTTIVEPEFFVDVVKMAKKHGFMVISDMAYADITFDGYRAPSFLATPGAMDVGVELSTMSKSYNMAGWRIGFCSGNSEMTRALSTIKSYYDYGTFAPLQIAAIVAMRDGDEAVREQATVYQRRRDILCDGLARIGWEVTKPKATMFIWQKIPEPWCSEMSAMEFSMMLLRDADVVVSPGDAFGQGGAGYLRMALVEKDDRLRQAVRQISRALGTK